uniref:Nucleotidyltransferase domain-containing protein n=1 Tax=Candidatus Kentrum sp. DK TaxID=2126562 RepID=A0A450S2K0_9GAMM|nr:MAG: hypothetical protein BECKDK2373C_GA0170839_10135 [Candidatus Kentron sp. DK]
MRVLVGFHARDEAKPDSDVDVVFRTDKTHIFLTATMKQDTEQGCAVCRERIPGLMEIPQKMIEDLQHDLAP